MILINFRLNRIVSAFDWMEVYWIRILKRKNSNICSATILFCRKLLLRNIPIKIYFFCCHFGWLPSCMVDWRHECFSPSPIAVVWVWLSLIFNFGLHIWMNDSSVWLLHMCWLQWHFIVCGDGNEKINSECLPEIENILNLGRSKCDGSFHHFYSYKKTRLFTVWSCCRIQWMKKRFEFLKRWKFFGLISESHPRFFHPVETVFSFSFYWLFLRFDFGCNVLYVAWFFTRF